LPEDGRHLHNLALFSVGGEERAAQGRESPV
jgi:hypothetical protein